MYLHEPIFDLDELFSRNYHIHTCLSRCAKPEMTLESIINAAQAAGLKEIAVTDHIHPGESWKLGSSLPLLRSQLKNTEHGVRVYIGAELSAYGEKKYTLKNADHDLDYRLYAHNHYHMFGWEQPEDKSPFGYKEHCKKVLTTVITSGRADCMAHPFNDYYIVREFGERLNFSLGDITAEWSENELGDMLALGKRYSTAWEINAKSCKQAPELMKKLWALGKELGVCFNYGTDAHVLRDIRCTEAEEFIRSIFGK